MDHEWSVTCLCLCFRNMQAVWSDTLRFCGHTFSENHEPKETLLSWVAFAKCFIPAIRKVTNTLLKTLSSPNCKMETIMRITRRNAHSVHSRVLNMRTFFASFFSLWQKYNSQGTHEPGKMHMLIVPAQRSEVSLSYIWRTCHKPNDQPTNQIQCKEGGLQKFLVPHSYQKCGLID
jgi:hypothetical protein